MLQMDKALITKPLVIVQRIPDFYPKTRFLVVILWSTIYIFIKGQRGKKRFNNNYSAKELFKDKFLFSGISLNRRFFISSQKRCQYRNVYQKLPFS